MLGSSTPGRDGQLTKCTERAGSGAVHSLFCVAAISSMRGQTGNATRSFHHTTDGQLYSRATYNVENSVHVDNHNMLPLPFSGLEF